MVLCFVVIQKLHLVHLVFYESIADNTEEEMCDSLMHFVFFIHVVTDYRELLGNFRHKVKANNELSCAHDAEDIIKKR